MRLVPWLGFVGIGLAAGFLGMISTRKGLEGWYPTLRKPAFNPPSWVFGPVWSTLYVLMGTSAALVWPHRHTAAGRQALGLWGTQMALNAAWSPLFFGSRRPGVALVDLLGMWGAIAAYTVAARKVSAPAAWMMLPYLGWVSFAGLLNEEIVRLNPGAMKGLSWSSGVQASATPPAAMIER